MICVSSTRIFILWNIVVITIPEPLRGSFTAFKKLSEVRRLVLSKVEATFIIVKDNYKGETSVIVLVIGYDTCILYEDNISGTGVVNTVMELLRSLFNISIDFLKIVDLPE